MPSTHPQSRVRYAVIGLGHIAQAAVLPAFKHASANSELAAIVSGDRDKREQVGDLYGVRVRCGYEDLERCLDEVDAVYIATPNSEHASYAIRAARMKKHVLCEKPLAVTDVDCDAIIAAAADADV